MKRSLPALLSLFAACDVGHMVGNNTNHDAITCATTTCNGTTVCVADQCVTPSGQCGGIAGLACPSGQTCVDNPRDACDPTQGGADCGGVCVAASSTPTDGGNVMHCGGLVANPQTCPGGYKCVDDPNSCSMALDCPGICVVDTTPQVEHCGGHVANPHSCSAGYKCVDDPNSCSMAADCPGICVIDTSAQRRCGGFVANPMFCNSGEVCVDDPNSCSMAVDCTGICVTKVFCGGFANIGCAAGSACVDEPNDGCDPHQGGADCGGYCVPQKTAQQFCGGFAGIACPSGLNCVDDPSDNCNPSNGGADCGGVCVP